MADNFALEEPRHPALRSSVLTAGVDLAAEPKKTAVAVIEWRSGLAVLEHLQLGGADAEIAVVASRVDAIGIDCAFGWPDDFVEFVRRHAEGLPVDLTRDEGMSWRRRLAYRETDRFVQRLTGRAPLSVATDRLGLTAMRCAALLDVIASAVGPIDRSGAGPVVEVYPAAALRVWQLAVPGYKQSPEVRKQMLAEIQALAPWLEFADHAPLMIASDDAFDAVIAALIARAHALDQTHPVAAEHAERARREGWIAIPHRPFGDLIAGRSRSKRSTIPAPDPKPSKAATQGSTFDRALREGDSIRARLARNRDEINRLASANKLSSVKVLESVARGDDGPDSDVDFLVEPIPGASYFDFARFAMEMEHLLGRRVDVISRRALDPIRDAQILRDATNL